MLPEEPGLDERMANVSVTLTEHGCTYARLDDGSTHLLAFTPGAEFVPEAARVLLPDGSELVDGGTYDLVGGRKSRFDQTAY